MKTKTPLEKAIEAAGGQTALGNAIGRPQSTVRTWLVRGAKVPAEVVRDIERATCGTVTRYELRPDIFGVGEDRVA